MDILEAYHNLPLFIFATSLLALLGLRSSTGSNARQLELIKEFRASLEQTSRNCMLARSTALAREFEAHDNGMFRRGGNGVPPMSRQLVGRHYVEESERLIRALASLARDGDDARASHLKRRLKELKRVQMESLCLLAALENDGR